ncbi:hypothetical protein ACFZB6_26405 [Streptomyces syringium]|uniref:hypothetical protein n=1 Tax=Streptomyces syringium TaxID=76729 RepID=UPI0033A6CF96
MSRNHREEQGGAVGANGSDGLDGAADGISFAGIAPWSQPVHAQAGRLREQAARLREGAAAVSLPGAEGAALRRRILGHAARAESAARSLDRTADALFAHEAVLTALATRRRETGGATHLG